MWQLTHAFVHVLEEGGGNSGPRYIEFDVRKKESRITN
jgi:hypothetical protein